MSRYGRQEIRPPVSRTRLAIWLGALMVVGVGVGLGIRGAMKPKPQPPHERTQGYLESVAGSLHHAEESNCRNQMLGVHRMLQSYAGDHGGKLPSSLAEGYKEVPFAAHAVACPGRGHEPYRYVSGLTVDGPAEAVVVYEEQPAHRGKCMVLRLGGQVELVEPQALQEELQAVRALTQSASMPAI